MDFMDCQPLTKHCFPHLNKMIYLSFTCAATSVSCGAGRACEKASKQQTWDNFKYCVFNNVGNPSVQRPHTRNTICQETSEQAICCHKTPSMWLTIYAIFILLKREIKGNFLFGLRRGTPLGQSGTVVSLTTYSGLLVKQGVGSTSKTTTKLVPNWPYCFKTTVDLLAGQPSARCGGQK